MTIYSKEIDKQANANLFCQLQLQHDSIFWTSTWHL